MRAVAAVKDIPPVAAGKDIQTAVAVKDILPPEQGQPQRVNDPLFPGDQMEGIDPHFWEPCWTWPPFPTTPSA